MTNIAKGLEVIHMEVLYGESVVLYSYKDRSRRQSYCLLEVVVIRVSRVLGFGGGGGGGLSALIGIPKIGGVPTLVDPKRDPCPQVGDIWIQLCSSWKWRCTSCPLTKPRSRGVSYRQHEEEGLLSRLHFR